MGDFAPKEIEMENNFEKENEQLDAQNETCEEIASESVESIAAEAPAKKFPWWIIAVAAVAITAIIALVVALASGNKPAEPVYEDYSITVVDELGNPMSNVMVKFTDSEGTPKTRITDKDGKVTFVGVLVGESVVNLEKGFSDAIILTEEYNLDANTTSLTAVVADETKIRVIYGDVADDTYAYAVGAGTYNVRTNAGEISYLIFLPSVSGIYKVSFTSDDSDMKVAHHGIPMYVQANHTLDGAYDGKSFEIIVHDIGTPHVIGLNATETTTASLTIERTGDAPFDPQFVEWTEVTAKEQFAEFNTGLLMPLDISDSSLSVTLGDDGYYYTADGKLVYARITSTSQYLEASIALIAGFVDENVGQNFGGYVYDNDGNFVAKYSYNSMIGAYSEHCDANGVYPLTEELAEAIKLHGSSAGWWNPTSSNFLFNGHLYSEENAWLFLCCTAE